MNFFAKNNKILCFADLHLGVHQDSSQWHENSLKIATFIDECMQRHKLDTIFFAGDFFHDRKEIAVSTLSVAKAFLKRLERYKIYAIPGNHDCFYKENSKVNSLSPFSNDNLYVFDQIITLIFNDKKITFCPWGASVEEIPQTDCIIGHFELNTFRMSGNKICESGLNPQTLKDKSQAKAIITGHFHKRDHRIWKNDNSYICYLGSPYELDLSDRDQHKGVSLLDLDDLSLTFIENKTTPKHVKLSLSDIIKYKSEQIKELITNNIIVLVIDISVDQIFIHKLLQKLSNYNPQQVRVEYNLLEDKISYVDLEKTFIDIEHSIIEYINAIEYPNNKEILLKKCLDLYKACL